MQIQTICFSPPRLNNRHITTSTLQQAHNTAKKRNFSEAETDAKAKEESFLLHKIVLLDNLKIEIKGIQKQHIWKEMSAADVGVDN